MISNYSDYDNTELRAEAQDLFDKIVCGVLAQGGPSLTEGTCTYRGKNGRKCAAGFAMPDERYTPEMEFHLADELLDYFPEWEPHVKLLNTLQYVHDNSTNRSITDDYVWDAQERAMLKFAFKTVAKAFGLNMYIDQVTVEPVCEVQ